MDQHGTTGFWNIAEETPDRIAIIDPLGERISFGDLYSRVNQISHGLRALGLTRGDHISTTLPNCIDQFAPRTQARTRLRGDDPRIRHGRAETKPHPAALPR